MPRKPNYKFERSERERQKAAKKAARLAAKQEKAEARKAGDEEALPGGPEEQDAPAVDPEPRRD